MRNHRWTRRDVLKGSTALAAGILFAEPVRAVAVGNGATVSANARQGQERQAVAARAEWHGSGALLINQQMAGNKGGPEDRLASSAITARQFSRQEWLSLSVTNIIGHTVATVVTAKICGEFDPKMAQQGNMSIGVQN